MICLINVFPCVLNRQSSIHEFLNVSFLRKSSGFPRGASIYRGVTRFCWFFISIEIQTLTLKVEVVF